MSDSYVPANGGPKSLGILGIDRKDGESTKLQAPGPSGIEKDVANVFEGCVKFTMNGKSIWCAGGTSYKAFDDFKKVIHVFRSLVWRNNEKAIVKSVIATYTKPFEYTSHYVR